MNDQIVQTSWTLCANRLPPNEGRYLVTYDLVNHYPFVDIMWYGIPQFGNHMCFFTAETDGDVERSDIIAWAYPPKPYGR